MLALSHRSKTRRRIVAVVLAVSMLVLILLPLAQAGASAYNLYEHIRQLGTDGMSHLLDAKEVFLPSSTKGSCSSPTAPTASATSTASTTPPGTETSLPGLLSSVSLGSVNLKAFTDPDKLNEVYGDFLATRQDFIQLNTQLQSHPTLLSLAGMNPNYAKQIKEAKMIAAVGIDLGTLGEEATTTALALIKGFPQDPLSTADTPLVTSDEIPLVQMTLNDAEHLLGDIQTRLAQVDPQDLPISACQRRSFAKAAALLPEAQHMLDQANALLPIGIWALGIDHPRNFLVQTMDRAELRPGGGFLGQYGVVTVNGGRIGPLALQDIAWLDYCGTGTCYALGNHAPGKWSWWPFANWGLRDSNLSADFPTTAQVAVDLFAKEGGGQVDGVINLTPLPIEHILAITGPIYIPDYNETITAQNLEDRLHYYQQNPAGIARERQISAADHSITARKRFTSLVGRLLQDRIRHLPMSQLVEIAKQMLADLRSKDLEVYLTDPAAEALLTRYGLDSSLDRGNTTDTWMLVQANISVSKASQYVQTTQQDDVQLDASGGATHHLTISLNYQKQGDVYGPSTYRDYLRVYAPAGSQLLYGAGFSPRGSPSNTTSDEPGLAMWGGLVVLEPFHTATISLSWYTPNVAVPGRSVAFGQPPYTLLVQRQSGTFNDLEVTITPSADAASMQGRQSVSFSSIQDTNQLISLPTPGGNHFPGIRGEGPAL
jgi:hypothetical protein